MNEYEQLFHIKGIIEKDVKKHSLFRLSKIDAINCVFTKVGIMYSMLMVCDEDKKQAYLKKIIHTNSTYLNETDFLQESLKWICRWCADYCAEESEVGVKVYADEIYELMGYAYSYEQFNSYWCLHSNRIVKYARYNNVIEFKYINEESHQIHELYDTVIRKDCDNKQFSNVMINRDKLSDFEMIEMIHREDFSMGYNFNFGKFCLNEYEEFSTVLNNYIINKIGKSHILVPGEAGIMCFQREEMIEMVTESTELKRDEIESMIEFFLYDYADRNSDLSLTYFLPQDDNRILVSEGIFNMQRPAINALRLLAKRQSELYKDEQNQFENEQRKRVTKSINPMFMVAEKLTKEQQLRPGMDLIVYDKEHNHLQIIELKYKIPIESIRDIINLDNMLKKAYEQIEQAKDYVSKNRENLLKEYFGEVYSSIMPDRIDFFVMTNYSIGTGTNCELPSPILLEEHYFEMMKSKNGMKNVHEALLDTGKKIIGKPQKRYARYLLAGYKMKIPETFIERRDLLI